MSPNSRQAIHIQLLPLFTPGLCYGNQKDHLLLSCPMPFQRCLWQSVLPNCPSIKDFQALFSPIWSSPNNILSPACLNAIHISFKSFFYIPTYWLEYSRIPSQMLSKRTARSILEVWLDHMSNHHPQEGNSTQHLTISEMISAESLQKRLYHKRLQPYALTSTACTTKKYRPRMPPFLSRACQGKEWSYSQASSWTGKNHLRGRF